jgi:hypothetical protein
MYKLILKVKSAIEQIEREKGSFKIKSLVAKNADNIQWDLVLSAEWFDDKNQLERMDYLAKKILSGFDFENMMQFSGIVTFAFNESNPFINLLNKIQDDNFHGKYPDCGGYSLVEPHEEDIKWIIPLNTPVSH